MIGNGSGKITTESRTGERRRVRGGKNCIRSNHIRERHRVLRNQLNGEKLVVWRKIAGPKRVEGVKKREKGVGKTTEQTALSSGWSGEKKDGTCSNQGISRYTYIFSFQLSFLSFSSSISSPIFSFVLTVIIYILFSWRIHQVYIW